jgi:hypothetical protein
MIPLSPSGTPPKLGGELVTDAAYAECGLSQLVFRGWWNLFEVREPIVCHYDV